MTRNLGIAAAILAGLSLAGCMQSTKPLDSTPTPTALRVLRPQVARAQAIPNLTASVEVAEHVAVTGSTVSLDISVTNHERVRVTTAEGPPYFIVYDRDGNQVSPGLAGGYSFPNVFTVESGQTVHVKWDWLAATAYYDDGVKFRPLPPGLYRVRAYLAPGWPLPWDTYLSSPRMVRLVEQEPSVESRHL